MYFHMSCNSCQYLGPHSTWIHYNQASICYILTQEASTALSYPFHRITQNTDTVLDGETTICQRPDQENEYPLSPLLLIGSSKLSH